MKFPKILDFDDAPPIFVRVYDKDQNEKNDFLGSVILDIKTGLKEGWITMNEKPSPKWFDLHYSNFTKIKYIVKFKSSNI